MTPPVLLSRYVASVTGTHWCSIARRVAHQRRSTIRTWKDQVKKVCVDIEFSNDQPVYILRRDYSLFTIWWLLINWCVFQLKWWDILTVIIYISLNNGDDNLVKYITFLSAKFQLKLIILLKYTMPGYCIYLVMIILIHIYCLFTYSSVSRKSLHGVDNIYHFKSF